MISFIRSLINSKFGALIALLFVGVIAVGFALGDVTGSGAFGGLSGGNVAKVGNRDISLGEFNQALDTRLKAERRDNPTLDMANFVEGGGLDSTLKGLIDRYALAIFGDKYGVAVSKRLVDSEIIKIPGAAGVDGKFSQEAFRAFLGNIGLSEQTVRDDLTQNFFAQQILPTVGNGAPAPASLVLPYASLLLEKRSGEVGVIPSAAYFPKAPPTDAILTEYYRANSTKFTIPEKRAISYALFDADVVAAKAKPSDADIAADYKKNAAQYAASQSRDISQIILPTEAAAKSAADKIAAGQSLGAVAQEIGLSVTTNKDVTKLSLTSSTSKQVADAVFATSQGGTTAPARGSLGWYVVHVDAVKQTAARPLSAVSSEIAARLTTERQSQMLSELTSEIEDSFSSGETIADVAKANGLKVETSPKLFANGQNADNPGYKPIPEMQVILPAIFQMERDGDPQLVEIIPGRRFAMIAVADFEEAAPPPLAKVKQVVLEQWALGEGSKKAKVAAEQVRKAIASGKSLKEALASLNIPLPGTESVSGTRADLNKEGKQLSPPLAMMFAMKQGTAKVLQAPANRGWFVVQLNQVVKGNASGQTEMLAARRQEMTQLLGQEYAAQLINSAVKEVGVKKNEDGIKELRDRLTKRDANQ